MFKNIFQKIKEFKIKNPFKKYYCIKQYDITDCGAACLATISKQYGLKIPITKIREVAGTDKMGTNAYGVIKAAEKLGFTAKGVKGNMENFFSEFPLPAIAHVIVDGLLLHYVAIHSAVPCFGDAYALINKISSLAGKKSCILSIRLEF